MPSQKKKRFVLVFLLDGCGTGWLRGFHQNIQTIQMFYWALWMSRIRMRTHWIPETSSDTPCSAFQWRLGIRELSFSLSYLLSAFLSLLFFLCPLCAISDDWKHASNRDDVTCNYLLVIIFFYHYYHFFFIFFFFIFCVCVFRFLSWSTALELLWYLLFELCCCKSIRGNHHITVIQLRTPIHVFMLELHELLLRVIAYRTIPWITPELEYSLL